MPSALLPFFYKVSGHAAGLLGIGGFLAAVDYKNSVTLGSIVIVVVIAAIAGLFTVRAKIASSWREEAEAEKAKAERLQAEIVQMAADRAKFDQEQQELRHDLKNDIATLKLQLQSAQAATDLTAALEAIRKMHETSTKVIADQLAAVTAKTVKSSEERDKTTHQLLEEIRDKMPATTNGGIVLTKGEDK